MYQKKIDITRITAPIKWLRLCIKCQTYRFSLFAFPAESFCRPIQELSALVPSAYSLCFLTKLDIEVLKKEQFVNVEDFPA